MIKVHRITAMPNIPVKEAKAMSNEAILISANLTPNKLTGLGNWTEEMFVARFKAYDLTNNMRGELKPVEFQTRMPWTMYAGMNTTDVKAIYAYLQSLEPIENKTVDLCHLQNLVRNYFRPNCTII